MRRHKYTVLIIAVLLISILLPTTTCLGSGVDYVEKIKCIIDSTETSQQELYDIMQSLVYDQSITKNLLLSKMNSLELKTERNFKTLARLEPSNRLQPLHVTMLDMIASFNFIVQTWRGNIKSLYSDKIGSLVELKGALDRYNRQQNLINDKFKNITKEMENAT